LQYLLNTGLCFHIKSFGTSVVKSSAFGFILIGHYELRKKISSRSLSRQHGVAQLP